MGNALISEKNDTMINLLLKVLCNLSNQTASKKSFTRYYEQILQGLQGIAATNYTNPNINSSFSSLMVNLSIDINLRSKDMSDDYLTRVTFIILTRLKRENEQLNLLKYLSSLGNICLGKPAVIKPLLCAQILNYVPPI